MFAIFFNWTEVFQSVGAHAGLCRIAVRELLAACAPGKHIGDTATIVADVRKLLIAYFSDYFDYDLDTTTTASLRVFHGHLPSAIAEVCDPRALEARMTATRGSGPAGHPNHKPLWNAYLYGTVVTTCTPAAGGLVAEMIKALPQDPALALAADADMAAQMVLWIHRKMMETRRETLGSISSSGRSRCGCAQSRMTR